MLGGANLRDMPERDGYGEIALDLVTSNGENWRLRRATAGGDFALDDLNPDGSAAHATLRQNHGHDRTGNVSGFLLDKIGLLGKHILKSGSKRTTQSQSFRNLARLVIVQRRNPVDRLPVLGRPVYFENCGARDGQAVANGRW